MIDQYGHSITVNYRGAQKFKTIYGSIVSIFVMTLIMTYTGLRFKKLVLNEEPNVSKNMIIEEMSEYGIVRADENRFHFGFGLIRISDWTFVRPDPRFLELAVRRVDM
jgi:hypothetical protein